VGLLDHALLMTATTADRRFERVFLAIGGPPLAIGRSLGLPLSEGKPLGRVQWSSASRGLVTGRDGRAQLLEPNRPVRLSGEGVDVELLVVRRFWLRPFGNVTATVALAWMVCVLGASVGMDSGAVAWNLHCKAYLAAGKFVPAALELYAKDRECNPPSADGGPLAAMDYTELLERMLKEDYAGEDKAEPTPPKDPRIDARRDWYYIPAGNQGPITDRGGAEDVAVAPVRVPEPHAAEPLPPSAPAPADGPGETEKKPAPPAPEERPVGDDGLADASEIGAADDTDLPTPSDETPAEEKQGWGVQDWYDAADANRDKAEIQQELRAARTRLKIDPDDPQALMVLSYYEYLSQDYQDASKTYDRYIELYPEDSAGYNNKALIYKRQKRYTEEEALYRQALALEPNERIALENLALNLAHQQRFDEALAVMAKVERLDPLDAYADLHRAKIYAQMGDDEKAYFYLDKACAGMERLDTLHLIEFRQDIRLDPSFDKIRETERFHAIMVQYYGKNAPALP
jgi:tetratricopeptide (TPR) repeat protein